MPPERTDKGGPWIDWSPRSASTQREYLEVFAVLGAVTLAGWLLTSHTGYLPIGMIYMLSVIALSLRVGRWPVLAAGIFERADLGFLFIPPIFTFVISKFEDGVLFGMYFAVALVTGQLTARVRGAGAA